MKQYPHQRDRSREMGFLGPLIGLGTTIVGAIMADSASEDAAEEARKRQAAEWKYAQEATSAAYAAEMDLWRERKEATRETRALEESRRQEATLKRAQTYRTVAIAGALGLGVIGIGLMLR